MSFYKKVCSNLKALFYINAISTYDFTQHMLQLLAFVYIIKHNLWELMYPKARKNNLLQKYKI